MRYTAILLEKSAAQKLLRDAIREESKSSTERKAFRLSDHDSELHSANAWDGDEHPQDTSLRMLLDAKKPLRSGNKGLYGESRLKTIQKPTHTDNLIPSDPSYQTWDATYVAPSHASGSQRPAIYRARNTAEIQALQKVQSMDLDSRTKAHIRNTKKSKAKVRRISNAREGALDYSLTGSLDDVEKTEYTKARPQNIQAWNSHIEDQIQVAQRNGKFSNLPGRGKPLASLNEENAFISRDEQILNRLISRQGAVPPFVEMQMSVERETTSFRNYLREEIVKRALVDLPNYSSDDVVCSYRDQVWEDRNVSYHNILIDRVNSIIKSYNAIAPAFSRRGLLVLETEMKNAREEALPVIINRLRHPRATSKPAKQDKKPSTLIGRIRELFGGVN